MTDTEDRARTPLLTLITLEAVDKDYQVAASRRSPDHHAGPGLRLAVVGVVAAFAVLVTVAAVQTSQNADVNDASRSSLIERIESRRDRVNSLQKEIAGLRSDNQDAEDRLRSLGTQYADAQTRRASLAALTGFDRVRGDGVRVRMDNPPYADENSSIRDADLALLANALWGAGAEAIAINGQRLTAASGIRNSGLAIEVHGIGIAPPYTVTAIGDQRNLSANFVDSEAGLQLIGLTEQYGYSYDMENVDDLRLPAAPASLRALRSATYEPKPRIKGGGTP
ncbi:hypothetical protein ASE01_17600 [Nocardioides sp. Root190]|uniref:DUF881 domain-containing protein n=1 Tax=Nocardioides sp. Root190 TaxID=1736488 RepID=UPI0007021D88|nr:DUF881 domain-containing protein [Nocardioides sp. Root190]KRB73832.1 hypothetical protein ASE01_17600 [Nocardioides sp. Root190]